MLNRHKNWLVHKQTACGKDFSNPFMVDNLPKIVGFSTHLASCFVILIICEASWNLFGLAKLGEFHGVENDAYDQLEWVLWYAPWLSDQLEWICGMLHGLVINWSSSAIETSRNRVNVFSFITVSIVMIRRMLGRVARETLGIACGVCALFLVKLAMSPFLPKKFRMGVAIATGRKGYYKPRTRAWLSRISRKISIPIASTHAEWKKD
ncbi:hypothetical protein Tco_0368333 [Tanacetum coccineum]